MQVERKRGRWAIWIALSLAALAAPQRLSDLDRLSFVGDEETSALPARALAEGKGNVMPTGMEYRRALPLTRLNAAIATRFGLENPWSYRVSSAVAGVISVPVVYGAARMFVGPQAALVTGVAVAFSEWHVLFSRMGRMYVPFLLFYVLSAWMLWSWVRGGDPRRLALGAAAFAGATSMHALALFALQFPVIALVFPGAAVSVGAVLVAVALMGVPSWLYTRWTDAPYGAWSDPVSGAEFGVVEATGLAVTPAILAGVALGIVGFWLGLRAARLLAEGTPELAPRWWQLAAGGTAGMAVALGHWWGAALCLAGMLLVSSGERVTWVRRACRPLAALAVLGAGSSAYAVVTLGLSEGIKSLVSFPFPYPLFMLPQFPLFMGLFALGCMYFVIRRYRPGKDGGDQTGPRGAALAALLTVAGIGVASSWGETRYLIHMYPFLLMVASWGLVEGFGVALTRLGLQDRGMAWRGAACALLILAGADPGHGVPVTVQTAGMTHGQPTRPATHVFELRPDHEGPGRYVRERLLATDVVVAEDPLQQHWYAGRVDYWLRHPNHAPGAVFRDDAGDLRDIYIGSRWPLDGDALARAQESAAGRIWVLTSAETLEARDLNAGQQEWLAGVRDTYLPVYVGRDGVTAVYCIPPRGVDPDSAPCPAGLTE